MKGAGSPDKEVLFLRNMGFSFYEKSISLTNLSKCDVDLYLLDYKSSLEACSILIFGVFSNLEDFMI